DLPVILVVDAHGMARSAAALVCGFQALDPDVKISGVIFNRVAGEGHYQILADAVKDVPLIGWLPANASIEIPERHLGLLTAKEESAASRIGAIGKFFANNINLDAVLSSVRLVRQRPDRLHRVTTAQTKRVALAHDKAFSFYYQANRIALEEAGA